jgi:hypothetical protein
MTSTPTIDTQSTDAPIKDVLARFPTLVLALVFGSVARCLRRIEAKCPADAATLIADYDLQDIVSLANS